MTEGWFSPDVARSFAFLSLLSIAAAFEPLAKQGRGRAIVTAIFGACVALGVLFLVAATVATWTGQPSYVLRSLWLAGIVVTIPFVAAFKEMQRIYREAEVRKTVAADL
jgi:predicted tellurium resistance membrane protein TerC